MFRGHTDIVWEIKNHPLKPLLASVSADSSVKLWDLNSLTSGKGPNGRDIIDDADALKQTIYFNNEPGNICLM